MYFSLPRTIKIRLANLLDSPGVQNLVSSLKLSRRILDDLRQYYEALRDPVSTCYDQVGFLFIMLWDHCDPWKVNLKFPWISMGELCGGEQRGVSRWQQEEKERETEV